VTNFDYIKNIPDGPNNPSVDQPKMKTNTNSINDLIGVDHITFNLNNGGFHTDIHISPQGADPAPFAGVGQLYTKTVGAPADQQLFYESGGGVINQLTGGANSATVNGFTFLDGGILFQWGQYKITTPDTLNGFFIITFPTAFPTTLFSVVATPFFTSSTIATNKHDWAGVNSSLTTFKIAFVGFKQDDLFSFFATGI